MGRPGAKVGRTRSKVATTKADVTCTRARERIARCTPSHSRRVGGSPGAGRSRSARPASRLDPWPDTRRALDELRAAGIVLAPLSNFSPAMIDNLMQRSGLRGHFDEILSTDRVRSYKPDPRAYDLGPRVLGLPREAIAFSAFGAWDAAGARWYGYPTFWVNRLRVPLEELAPGPDAAGSSLEDLRAWMLR